MLKVPDVKNPISQLILRRLTTADIQSASELRRLAGWNQSERDWLGYLEFEPEGCFAAQVGDKLVGTATTITYGKRLGWIGMILVHPEQRRAGIGTALLNATIAYLRAHGIQAIKLDATPMGKEVYIPLGFRDEYDLARYEGVASDFEVESRAWLEPLTTDRLLELAEFDAIRFGAERLKVLTSLQSRRPEWCLLARSLKGIEGYLIARPGSNAVQVGPWVARDPEAAGQLLQALFRRIPGMKVFVDVPGENRPGRGLMDRIGFGVQRGFTRMFLGENNHPGRASEVYSTSGAEKG